VTGWLKTYLIWCALAVIALLVAAGAIRMFPEMAGVIWSMLTGVLIVLVGVVLVKVVKHG